MSALPPTRWPVIDAARGGDEQAYQTLIERYQQPVVRYLAQRGLVADAEDLAQEVFMTLFKDGVIEGADPGKGRFRNLVLAVARNVANMHLRKQHTLKRGAGQQPLALDGLEVASAPVDAVFDREWLANLLDLSLRRLSEEHPSYYGALSRLHLEQQDYAAIAASLGIAKGDVKNLVHRGKLKLASFMRQEIRAYTSARGDYDTELELLGKMLG